jgi:hypothetical protein
MKEQDGFIKARTKKKRGGELVSGSPPLIPKIK